MRDEATDRENFELGESEGYHHMGVRYAFKKKNRGKAPSEKNQQINSKT